MGYFEMAVGLLFLLAVLDLTVGVSNDAVNFLNSAIGSRVASRRVILMVAGAGVLAGSLFSSGIMEVARSGIFNPQLYVFSDVLIIFLAVMLADVLVLDLFNTFGLPTSTTVSIVFELLGAATAIALFAITGNPDAGSILDFINVRGALIIISGIVLSIAIAFAVGTAVQFFSRMLFTFQERNHTDGIRIGWSAIAFTILSYFLVVKGLKGASFVSPDTYDFLIANAVRVTVIALLVWAAAMWILSRLGVDLLAAVVLGGTFSLALAFASNDLVNFIGVPLAGLSAWEAWSASGLEPDRMMMQALLGPVRADTLTLLAAGAVMVTTLWFSSKARSVTQTEVSLGRQGDGAERFRPGPVSRGIVRTFIATGEAVMRTIPQQWLTGLAQRFERERQHTMKLDQPAFDKLRASVNLTVASILIVFATSLKLPLSTTFVSFMVAMGTALADRAWGRDSAVYRLAGVFSVIGGWFVTALGAFAVAATFAVLIKLFGGYAIGVLLALAMLALVHTHRYHRRRSRMQEISAATSPDRLDRDALVLREQFSASLENDARVLDQILSVLISRDRKATKNLRLTLEADALATRHAETEFVRRLDVVKPRIEPWLMQQLEVLACERDLLQSATTLVELASEHVLNEHAPPSPGLSSCLTSLRDHFRDAFTALSGNGDAATPRRHDRAAAAIPDELDRATRRILEDLYAGRASPRNATLLLGIVLEMRDLHRELGSASTW
jgi:phosphate/sulfate permease